MTDTEKDAQEYRHAPRKKTLRAATIVYNDAQCTMDCAVLDLSARGARLRPLDPTILPDRFDLRLADDCVVPCTLVRRTGEEVAVDFFGL